MRGPWGKSKLTKVRSCGHQELPLGQKIVKMVSKRQSQIGLNKCLLYAKDTSIEIREVGGN